MIGTASSRLVHLPSFNRPSPCLLADPLFGPETLNVLGVLFAKEVFQHLHALCTCGHGCDFTNRMADVTEDIGGVF